MLKIVSKVLTALIIGVWGGAVSAGVIISPGSYFDNTFTANLDPNNMINQSGLTPFTSGVTDADTYLASTPVHSALSVSNAWASGPGSFIGSISFDLGNVFTIDRFILWGDDQLPAPQNNSAPNAFSLVGSLTSDFSSSVLLGSFNGASAAGSPIPAQVFSFAATDARYVRWEINSNYGLTNINVGEVAFATGESVSVPAPATLGLFGLGLAGVCWIRRKRA